jgi:hypothetical protein
MCCWKSSILVPDLVAYLECKEHYLSQAGVSVAVAGEERLLARYICTMKDDKHTLPAIPAARLM